MSVRAPELTRARTRTLTLTLSRAQVLPRVFKHNRPPYLSLSLPISPDISLHLPNQVLPRVFKHNRIAFFTKQLKR